MQKKDLKHRDVETCGTTVFVLRDSGKEIVNMDNLPSNIQDGCYFYWTWTLEDIAVYVQMLFPNEQLVIYVWEETGLSGWIFKYVSSRDYWVEHGSTKGFA